jgi:hypothetical protein
VTSSACAANADFGYHLRMEPHRTTPPPPARGWGVGRVVAAIAASLLVLLALALLAGGGVVLWADKTKRDDDGFLTTPAERLATTSYALVTEGLDVGVGGPDWLFREGRLGEIRISAERPAAAPVFVGVALESQVSRYLQGVEHDVVTDIDVDPFRVRYEPRPGGPPPGPPAERDFWAVQASGPGKQTLTWEVAGGRWVVLVMNAGATPGVVVDVSVGASLGFLDELAWGLLAAGALFALIAAVSLAFVFRRRRPPPPAPAAPS